MTLYCPAGHGPFEDWADRCPECGDALVGREPIVLLTTAPNEPIAQMWLETLSDAGIRATAKALGPGFGGWGTSVPLEHALYVLAPDVERARRIIAEFGGQRAGVRRPHPRPRRHLPTRGPGRHRG